jgi:hypothetical protein
MTEFNWRIDSLPVYVTDKGEAQVADQLAKMIAQKAVEPALPWQPQESVA